MTICKSTHTAAGRTPARLAAIITLTAAAACGQGSPLAPENDHDPVVRSIEVAPEQAVIAPGDSQRFTAIQRDLAGNPVGGAVVWEAAGGTITAGGLFTAGSAKGVYTITARGAGGVQGAARLEVDPELGRVRIAIGPGDASLESDTEIQFNAQLQGRGMTPADGSITWQATGGTVSPNGRYRAGNQPGDYAVVAEVRWSGGTAADTASVKVVKASSDGSGVASITLSPAQASLGVGGTARFQATLRDRNGVTTGGSIKWEATGGTILDNGLYTAGNVPGTYAVEVRSGNLRQTAPITIIDGSATENDPPPTENDPPPPASGEPRPASMTVSPAQAGLLTGDSLRFTATVRDQNGSKMPVTVGWKATGGTIRSNGLYVAGGSAGTFAVTADYAGLTAVAQVTISVPSAPPPPSSPPPAPPPATASGVRVAPGQSIQSVVDAHASGTTYILGTGVHRRQSIRPKSGDTFVGEVGAVLDGENAARFAFTGSSGVTGVTIRNLVIQHYAPGSLMGAVKVGDFPDWQQNASRGWVIEGCEIRENRHSGVMVGTGLVLRGNHIHHNGETGITGYGDDILIEGNEVAYNNPSGSAQTGHEAGGMKLKMTRRLVVRNNYVHDNVGKGIWMDIDNIDALIEGNRVEGNTEAGIMHEIGYRAVIRNNTVKGNGGTAFSWLWYSGITVANSPNVEVYGNWVEGNNDGIGAIHQNRGSGAYGPYVLENLYVHDNVVWLNNGHTGLNQDVGDNSFYTSRNNRFERNTYHLGGNPRPFRWQENEWNEAQWRGFGQDANSVFNR